MNILKYYLLSLHLFGTCDINRVLRTVEVDDEKNPKYKFQELVEFSNPKVENKFAICIGFNPAKAEEEMDTTNKRIINALQNEYSGYILLNIYPEITEKASDIDLDDNVNSDFFKDLVKQVDNYSSYDVILFLEQHTILQMIKKYLLIIY